MSKLKQIKDSVNVNWKKARFTVDDQLTLRVISKKAVTIYLGNLYANDKKIKNHKAKYSIVRLHYFGYIEEKEKGRLVITPDGLVALDAKINPAKKNPADN